MMFKTLLFALVSVLSIQASAQTQSELAKVDISDYYFENMMEDMKLACMGTVEFRQNNPITAVAINVAKASLHPILIGNFVIRSTLRGNLWTGNFVNQEVGDSLRAQVKFKMQSAQSCYYRSGYYFKYESIAADIDKALTDVFEDSEFRPNGSYMPAEVEQQEMLNKCVGANVVYEADSEKIAYEMVKNALGSAGQKLILDERLVGDIYNLQAQKLMLGKKPQTCEEYSAIHTDIISRMAKWNHRALNSVTARGYKLF